jgi:hypothetical protein
MHGEEGGGIHSGQGRVVNRRQTERSGEGGIGRGLGWSDEWRVGGLVSGVVVIVVVVEGGGEGINIFGDNSFGGRGVLGKRT